MAVDKEVFRTQGNLIKDALNIMWADQETRNPHHPLRDLNMLMWYNVNTGLWDFRDDVLDAVYDNGAFPTRGYGPRRAIIKPEPETAVGNILIAEGFERQNAALVQFGGDLLTASIDISVDSAIATTVAVVSVNPIGAANMANLLAKEIEATMGINTSTNGGLLYISINAPAIKLDLTNLAIT